jgi:hypothetical protein
LSKEKTRRVESEEEIYQEGHNTVIEDEEGNVLGVRESRQGESEKQRMRRDNKEAGRLLSEKDVEHGVAQTEHGGKVEEAPGQAVHAIKEGLEHPAGHPAHRWNMRKRMQSFSGRARPGEGEEPAQPPKAHKPPQKRGPALAYQFGNTIIVEDEDGEVLKKYDIPGPSKDKPVRPGMDRKASMAETGGRAMQSIRRMGTYVGMPARTEAGPSGTQDVPADGRKKQTSADNEDDDGLRFTVTAGGRRMSKAEFITQMSKLDPKSRAKLIADSDVPEEVKEEAKQDAKDEARRRAASTQADIPPVIGEEGEAQLQKIDSPGAHREDRKRGPGGLTLVDSDEEDIPFHSVHDDLAKYKMGQSRSGETAAQRRRRLAEEQAPHSKAAMSEADTTPGRQTPAEPTPRSGSPATDPDQPPAHKSRMDEGETAAERKRRLGALGLGQQEAPDSDSEEEEGGDPLETGRGTGTHHGVRGGSGHGQPQGEAASVARRTPGIRFAEQPRIPTKDERKKQEEQEEARGREGDKEGAGGSKGMGKLGKLKWKK